MIKIKTITIDEVKFPTLRLGKGDWISFALPSGSNSHQLLGAYCKHIKFQSRQGIFETKKTFQWLNLTHTNTAFSRKKTLKEMIEEESEVDQEFMMAYVEKELKQDVNRRMKYVDATKRVPFLYQLKKKKADIIAVSMAGMEPWGVQKIRAALQEDQAQNRVVEFCYAVSRRYNIAKESKLIKLAKGEENENSIFD